MNKLIGILKTLIAGYIITIALLIIISICMYKMSLSNNIISICITAAYGISTFAGGLILGHIRKCNRLIWGILYGIIYFCILCVISVAINQGSGFVLLLLQNVLAYAVPAAVLVAFFPHR